MDGVKGVAVDRFPWWDHVGVISLKVDSKIDSWNATIHIKSYKIKWCAV